MNPKSMGVEGLIRALDGIGLEVGPGEILDALWLASQEVSLSLNRTEDQDGDIEPLGIDRSRPAGPSTATVQGSSVPLPQFQQGRAGGPALERLLMGWSTSFPVGTC